MSKSKHILFDSLGNESLISKLINKHVYTAGRYDDFISDKTKQEWMSKISLDMPEAHKELVVESAKRLKDYLLGSNLSPKQAIGKIESHYQTFGADNWIRFWKKHKNHEDHMHFYESIMYMVCSEGNSLEEAYIRRIKGDYL